MNGAIAPSGRGRRHRLRHDGRPDEPARPGPARRSAPAAQRHRARHPRGHGRARRRGLGGHERRAARRGRVDDERLPRARGAAEGARVARRLPGRDAGRRQSFHRGLRRHHRCRLARAALGQPPTSGRSWPTTTIEIAQRLHHNRRSPTATSPCSSRAPRPSTPIAAICTGRRSTRGSTGGSCCTCWARSCGGSGRARRWRAHRTAITTTSPRRSTSARTLLVTRIGSDPRGARRARHHPGLDGHEVVHRARPRQAASFEVGVARRGPPHEPRRGAPSLHGRRSARTDRRVVECRKDPGVIDEAPKAYKNIDRVMDQQRDLVENRRRAQAGRVRQGMSEPRTATNRHTAPLTGRPRVSMFDRP